MLADREVMEKVLDKADTLSKPVVAVFLGADEALYEGHKVYGTFNLTDAAKACVRMITGKEPELGLTSTQRDEIAQHSVDRLSAERMIVVEDRRNHTHAATFPAEGPFEGGFCGWGLYSKEIAENLRHMREDLFPPMREMLAKNGGIPLKPILAESLQMGDENHTRQTAADPLQSEAEYPPACQ